MIKVHYKCEACGSSTNEKYSGSVINEPKTLEEAVKRFPEVKCYYCGSVMFIENWVDSSFGSFMCNSPTISDEKLEEIKVKNHV